MSNSVVFLLMALGLSVLGAGAVWLHGHPRRGRKANNDLGVTLRVLAENRRSAEPVEGVRPVAPPMPMSARDPRRMKEPRSGS